MALHFALLEYAFSSYNEWGIHPNQDQIRLGFSSGLPTLRFKKVWKLREVLNVPVTAGYKPAQAQKEPDG